MGHRRHYPRMQRSRASHTASLTMARRLDRRRWGETASAFSVVQAASDGETGTSFTNSVTHKLSHETAKNQPPTTSLSQCTPRYTRVRPTANPHRAIRAAINHLPRGARSRTAPTSSPAVIAAVVLCPDGKDQPEACVAQSSVGGRGRATTSMTPLRRACPAPRQAMQTALHNSRPRAPRPAIRPANATSA